MRVKKSTGDRDMTALAVEAEPVGFGAGNEIPNDSVEALRGLLAAGGPAGSERLVATRLKDISHSPFYNLTVGGSLQRKPWSCSISRSAQRATCKPAVSVSSQTTYWMDPSRRACNTSMRPSMEP